MIKRPRRIQPVRLLAPLALAVLTIGVAAGAARLRGPAGTMLPGAIGDLAIFAGGGLVALVLHRLLFASRSRAGPAGGGENEYSRLTEVLDHLPCYVGLLDADGTLLWCNEPPLRDLRLALEDAAGRKFWDTPWWSHDAAVADDVRAAVLEAARGGSPRFDTTVARADGPPIPVDFRVERVLDAAGQIRYLVPAAIDLTGRKNVEQALIAAERRMRTLFEHSADPMSISDMEHRILEINPRGCDVLGYTRDDLLSLRIDDITQMDAGRVEYLHKESRAVAPDPLTFEAAILRKDGSTYPAEVRTVAIDWEGRRCILAAARDLTERNRAAESLRASERRFRTLIEDLADPLFLADEKGRILEVNPRACESLGRSRDELLRMGLRDIDAQLSWEEIAALMARLARDSGTPLTFETRHRRADGTTFPVEIRAIPIEWDGQVRYLSLTRDQTVRKEAERALRESEQKLRLFVEYAPAALAMFDREMRYLVASRSWCGHLGLDRRDYAGHCYYDLMPGIPGDWREAHRRALAGEIVRHEGECIPDATGQDRWIRWEVRPWHDGGCIAGIVVFAEDITEQHLAARATAESEARYRSLFEANPHPMWVFDLETLAFLAVNDAAVVHYGYSRDEFLAMTIAEIRPPDDVPRLLESVHQVRDSMRTEGIGVWRHRRKDGTLIDVEITSHRMTYAGRPAGLILSLDVTERLLAEAGIRESEERFRTVVDSVPTGILAVDGSGRITLANRRTLEWFGYEREELVGRSIDVLVPGGIRHRHEGLWRDYFTHPVRRDMGTGRELRGVRKDGSEFPVEVGLTLVPGEVPMVLAVVTDITERRRAEVKTREELAFRETLLEAIPAPVFYKDVAGRYLGGNAAFFRFVGWRREDALGKTAADLVPDELAELYAEMDRRLYEQPGAQVYETGVREAGGELREVIFHKATIPDDSGRPRGIVGMILDVTELRKAEAAVRDLNADLERRVAERTAELAKLAAIVDASTDFIATATPDGESIWANRAMEQNVGRHGAAGSKVRIADSHPPDSRRMVLETGLPAAARDGHWLGETEVLADDGRIIPVSQLILSHRDAGGAVEFYSTIMRDITERKRMEAELARSSRLKDEFLAGMSHELRTPLNGILAFTEAIQEGVYGPVEDRQAEALCDIARCGRHLLGLINEILDLSKIEAGRMELEPEPTSIEDLCRACLRMVQEDAQKKRLSLRHAVIGVDAPAIVDPRRVRQILLNLLSNAVKFTPEGGAVSLEVEGVAADRQLLLTVRDTGIGIDPKHLDELFQPFRQLDARLSRQFEGTGLGLALVRKLSRLHGGDVEVESQPGRGSRFTVRLPWESAGEPIGAGEGVDLPAGGGGEPRESRPLVLLAEDNDINARVVRDYLRAHGFEVVSARDGPEALRLAGEHAVDAFVMDIQLPEIDGLEVIRRLRADARWRQAPILAMTALAMPGDRERCLEAGADEYLPKPVSLQQMLGFLGGRIRRRGPGGSPSKNG